MDFLLSDPARWIFAIWFAILGGAVGSFLNVVVYRLPAGLGISWPGSHCPQCKRAIRAYDNVPVLAWLWLRGRCRDCGRPISARYPLVEAITASVFLLLLVVEVFHEGHNLPMRSLPAAGQPAAYPASQAMAICLLHLGLLCTLMASALITLDGNCPPWRLFVPMLAAGCLAPMFWPWLRPQPSGPEIVDSPWAGVIDTLVGLAAGYCLGRAARWLGRRTAGVGRAGYQVWGETMLLGVVLGWRAAVVLLLCGMMLEEITRMAALRWRRLARVTAAVWLVPLALLWILNWSAIAAVLPAR
jgi:leader peptidase (prepilin peptidase)/N-methyltransferase